MINFTLPLTPIAKARPRMGRGGNVYTPKPTRGFENDVRKLARLHAPATLLTGPLFFRVRFYMIPPKRKVREYPSVKPDWDNLAKAVSDALNGIIWKDDCQIVDAYVGKFYDWTTRKPRIEISVGEVPL